MPIRRRGDGEIVEEPTNPPDGEGAATSPSEAATEPATVPRDSLFADAPSTAKERWDSPTKPIDRADREGKTRILSPLRRPSEDRGPQTDPMADPPVGWLVVVRGPGKGSVLTLGNGMNAIGRGTSSRVRLDFGDDNVSRANHARVAYDPRRTALAALARRRCQPHLSERRGGDGAGGDRLRRGDSARRNHLALPRVLLAGVRLAGR